MYPLKKLPDVTQAQWARYRSKPGSIKPGAIEIKQFSYWGY